MGCPLDHGGKLCYTVGKGGEFVYFLIDYENVRNLGMRGTEYLLSSDYVIVFYSESSPNMELRHLNDIQNSGCGFEVCKLLTKRKNGLDFYIATKVVELFGAERCKMRCWSAMTPGFKQSETSGKNAPGLSTVWH